MTFALDKDNTRYTRAHFAQEEEQVIIDLMILA
jgi:hypothetical protein